MQFNEYIFKKELLEVSTKALKGEITLVESCIMLNSFSDTSDDELDFLLPIIGIWSDFDDIVRDKYKISVWKYVNLTDYEKDLEKYNDEDEIKKIIFDACEEAIKIYEQDVRVFEMNILKVIEKNDPIRVYFSDLNGYVYDTEYTQLMKDLEKCQSEEQIEESVRYIFIDMYGEVPKEKRVVFKKIAQEIWTLIK